MAKKGRGKQHKANPRDLQRLFKAPASKPPKTEPPPSGFSHGYGQGLLYMHGPLIMVEWSVPAALEAHLRATNKPVPLPVRGAIILDTGATRTCISVKAAEALELKATRMVDGLGSGGDTRNPVFNARLSLGMANKTGQVRVIYWEQEVQGIPKMHEHFRNNPPVYAGEQVECVGLLGRDILATSRFHYDGVAGTLKLDFDLALMGLS